MLPSLSTYTIIWHNLLPLSVDISSSGQIVPRTLLQA